MCKEHPIIKNHLVPFMSDGPKKTGRDYQPHFFALFTHGFAKREETAKLSGEWREGGTNNRNEELPKYPSPCTVQKQMVHYFLFVFTNEAPTS